MINIATPPITPEAILDVVNVLQSGNLVQGKKVEEFEHMFARYIGTNFAVAVNSGTSALVASLLACGIKRGDKVAVPAYTFFATVEVVLLIGAEPVFIDLDPNDLTMSVDKFAEVASEMDAVIPVHIFGGVCNTFAIDKIASQNSVIVIEDCAQAHGAFCYDGSSLCQKVGSIGDAGCFSFYATKHITTIEGGIVTTNDRAIADFIKLYRNHGMTGYHTHQILGQNLRMNEVGAVLGISGLKSLDERVATRRKIAKTIMSATPHIKYYVSDPDNHAFFILPLSSTIELRSELGEHGIPYRKRYLSPLYNQPVVYNDYDYKRWGTCQVAEAKIPDLIGLPCHENLTDDDVNKIIEVLNER